jgi:hypothetical protein
MRYTHRLQGPPSLEPNGYRGLFRLKNGQGVKMTSHLNHMPRLRVRGAVPLLPLHAFLVWTGKTLSFSLILEEIHHARVGLAVCSQS